MTGLFRKSFAFVGVLVAVGAASVANASSYLRLDGVTVDPIQYSAYVGGGNHSYAGPNLEPGVQAQLAQLGYADLTLASLDHADLNGAFLDYTDFTSADLSFANLSSARIYNTTFDGANLRNADLSYANSAKGGFSFINVDATNANLSHLNWWIRGGDNSNFTNVDFTGSRLDGTYTNAIFVAADLRSTDYELLYADFAGATYSTGSLSNRTLFPTGFDPIARGMVLVPEPGTLVLVGIGLVGMSAVSQRQRRTRTTTHTN